jgi:copper(I)-binding protein
LAALVLAPAALAAPPPAGLVVSHAWMRFLIRARPAAGYFTLRNTSGAARELVGAASPGCGSLMLHQSQTTGGIDRMVMVKELPVPAHGAVTFAPGGYHLMCMDAKPAIKPGGKVPVTLSFKDGTQVIAEFAVRNAMGK